MSFSGQKDELLERMTTINDELHQFLERATVVNRQAASKPKVPFKELQSQAIKFYDCLAVRWRSCCCPSAHTLGIAAHIPSRSATKNGQLKVAFEHGGEIKQVKIGVEEVVKAYMKAPQQPSQQQLSVKKDDFDPEAAGRMRRQMKTEKQKMAATPDKDKSISVLQVAASHEAKPASRSILRRAAGKLRRSWKTTTPAVASHSVPSRVRFEVVSSSTVNPSTCGVEVEGAVVETEAEAEAEVDMCQFATWTINTASEGAPTANSYSVLRSEDLKIILRQESLDQSQLQASKTQTMDSFLGSMPLRFSRLAVGLRFALTLLSLSTSPWVPKELDKGDLFLISGSDKKTIPLGPYLSRSSRDIDSTKSSGGTWHAKSSLLLLGIVLLELFFGEPLERQQSWTESLVDGRLNEYTRFFSAFQWACLADDSLKQCFGRDLGGSLSEAIRKCIQFDFGRESEYGDSRFAEVVYKEVVVPLEKCCPI